MGWAGPAQPTGPDSAQNCWADFGPKWIGPISAQKTLQGQTRPRRQGWSGPTDWVRLSPKLLGRFRPKMDWADLGPKQILFWARPGPEDRAGPGSAWPSNQNGRGELFSPHPCMQNANRSACREEKKKMNARMRGKKSYLARGRRCW